VKREGHQGLAAGASHQSPPTCHCFSPIHPGSRLSPGRRHSVLAEQRPKPTRLWRAVIAFVSVAAAHAQTAVDWVSPIGAALLAALLASAPVGADTHTAASCSRADVQAAIDAASPGDTVLIPPGEATWDTHLVITKDIVLAGSGAGVTTIKGNVSAYLGLIRYEPAAPSRDHRFRMTAFTIDTDSKATAFSCYQSTAIPEYIEVDHMTIYALTRRAFYVAGTFFGAIRFNEIQAGTALSTYGSGNTQWAAVYAVPPTLARNYGDADDLYFEDNVVDAGVDGFFSDGGQGGRRVLRYNTYTVYHAVGMIDFHGNQVGGGGNLGDHPGGNPGTMVAEVYGNRLVDTKPGSYCQIMDQRGGHVLLYFNAVSTGQNRSVAQVREEFTDSLWPVNPGWVQKVHNSYHWGNWENGVHLVPTELGEENCGSGAATPWIPNHLYGTASPNSDIYCQKFTNDPTGSVWKKTTYSDSNGSPGGMVAPYLTGATEPNWASVPPRYVIADGNIHWVNLGTGSPIVPNVDFFVQTSTGTFDGTGNPLAGGGVGCGPALPTPWSCTPGVGYWVTQQGNCSDLTGYVGDKASNPTRGVISGTLYKCTSTNTWTELDRPYAYPYRFPGSEGGTRYYPVPPCRMLDTRVSSGAGAAAPALAAQQRRVFTIAGACGVPANAQAISANLTVVSAQALGDLRVVGGHLASTITSSLSIPLSRARANNAIVQLATDGSGTIAVTNDSAGSVHLILDVNGYFQ
jgi:hypothetical protein